MTDSPPQCLVELGGVINPSQIRNHIDKCKDWLLSSDTGVEDDVEVFVRPIHVDLQPQMMDNIGLVQNDIATMNTFACFICNTMTLVRDGNEVIANPFTRSHTMMLCGRCRQFETTPPTPEN